MIPSFSSCFITIVTVVVQRPLNWHALGIEITGFLENGDQIYNYLDDSNYFELIKPNLTPEMHFEDIIDKYFKKGGNEIIEKW